MARAELPDLVVARGAAGDDVGGERERATREADERRLVADRLAQATEERAVELAAAHGGELRALYVVDESVYEAYSGDEYVDEAEGPKHGLKEAGEAVRASTSPANSGVATPRRRSSPTRRRWTPTYSSSGRGVAPRSTARSSGTSPIRCSA